MNKIIKTVICVMGVCTLFLMGCSSNTSKNEPKTNKEKEILESESRVESNNDVSNNNVSNGDDSNNVDLNNNDLDRDISDNDDSNDTLLPEENNDSVKQAYLDKLNNLQAELSVELKDKYASPVTQDMLEAGNEEYGKWDDMLNEIYAELQEQLSEEEMDKLTEDELAWINVRDEKAAEEAKKVEDGSLEPVVKITCLVTSTRERCYELVNNYLE